MKLAPLDRKTLEELRALGGDDDPGFFQSVVEQFLQDAPGHIQTIHRAVSEHDRQALTMAAHTLKGSARNMGALPLSEICLVFEEYGREGRTENVDSLLESLDIEFSRACDALRQETNCVPPPMSTTT